MGAEFSPQKFPGAYEASPIVFASMRTNLTMLRVRGARETGRRWGDRHVALQFRRVACALGLCFGIFFSYISERSMIAFANTVEGRKARYRASGICFVTLLYNSI